MRSRLAGGSWFVFTFPLLAASTVLVASCSSSNSGPAAGDNEAGPGEPGSTADGGTSDDATAVDSSKKPAPPNDCKLGDVTGVEDVVPTFRTHEPPAAAPPAMTGGALSGTYKVDKAIVFLPTMTKGLADPTKSTGTVNAWAVFNGKNYRLRLKADFTVASVLGPQAQGSDVASQGGFTVSGSAVSIDHACDAKPPQEAEYTFTDNGSGRATILIKTTSTYGDTYLQLDAAKN